MVVYYSIARQSKYKKGDDGEYIDTVIAIQMDGEEPKTEEYRIKVAKDKKNWVAEQLKIDPFWLLPITKERFNAFEYEE